MSGKTTFAAKKAIALQNNGVSCIVLDPLADQRWKGASCFVTADREKFLEVVWNSRSCAIFVDEAGREIGKYSDTMNELATMGRHFGHKCHFITQRSKQLSPHLRDQCSELAIFKQSLADTRDLANEFVEEKINEAHTLQKGEFILVRDGQPTVKLNVFKL